MNFYAHLFLALGLLCATGLAQVYAPRRPQSQALYQAIAQNFETFRAVYDDQFLPRCGILRQVARITFEKFLTCGLLRYGFARAQCPNCPREFLIAFSCQRRGVCTSCAAKRIELFCNLAHDVVIAKVPHCQIVFVLPKRLRCFFQGHCKMTTKLCRVMQQSLTLFFRQGLRLKNATPGRIACIQTFGDNLNPHTHLHVLAAEGAFTQEGFHPSRYLLVPLFAVLS